MNKAFVDTSVILRLLVRDDDTQMKAAENLIRSASRRGVRFAYITDNDFRNCLGPGKSL